MYTLNKTIVTKNVISSTLYINVVSAPKYHTRHTRALTECLAQLSTPKPFVAQPCCARPPNEHASLYASLYTSFVFGYKTSPRQRQNTRASLHPD